MTVQTFPAGAAPRLVLSECRGDLRIEGWDQSSITIESGEPKLAVRQTDEALVIEGARSDLRLRLPHDAELVIEDHHGDVTARSVRLLAGEGVAGDLRAEAIEGVVQLRDVDGSVQVERAQSLIIEGRAEGDCRARQVVEVQIENVGGDLLVEMSQRVTIGATSGDLRLRDVAGDVQIGRVGGDTAASDVAGNLSLGSVGGDTTLSDVAGNLSLGSVGGDCTVKDIAGALRAANVGGDCTVKDIAGALEIGYVGGDASLRQIGANPRVGNVGGDLELGARYTGDYSARIAVGGDARIELDDQSSLTIRATVAGDVRGQHVAATRGGTVEITYGAGTARLELIVGGDLELRGGKPHASSSSSGVWPDFAEEIARMGDELGRIGEEIGRELSEALGSIDARGGRAWAQRAEQRAEEMRQRVEERVRRAEERARAQAERVRVRVNDREWRFDAERLEHLKRQARRAAEEGIAGAIEAIEHALAGLGRPPAPAAPQPAASPANQSEGPAEPSPTPTPAATGATMRMETEPAGSAPSGQETPAPAQSTVDAERTAILRMVAEGRISPEEGDMLLEALG